MGRIVSCFRPGPATDYYGSFRVERERIVPPTCESGVDGNACARLMREASSLGIKPSLASTFSGATIFLTGGTGYVGSVLIEQLLRSVPDLEAIYVLVRPKHGAEPEARIDRLLARPIFDSLRVPADEEVENSEDGGSESSAEEQEEETRSDVDVGVDVGVGVGVVAPSSPSSSSSLDGGSSSSSDVDSANNAAAGGRPDGAAVVSPPPSSSPEAAKKAQQHVKITDGVLQFKAPRRPLLPHLRAKLRVLPGDVCKPRCGLSDADALVVSQKCDFIVHCAASISFFEHVHVLLEQNYVATRNVLDLAAEAMGVVGGGGGGGKEATTMSTSSSSTTSTNNSDSDSRRPRLRGLVHVSTAYVNANLPRGTHVEERIYPLVRETTKASKSSASKTATKTKTVLSHSDVVAELMSLPAEAATKAANKLVDEFGFPNAYTLSKHLAEDAVAEAVERGFQLYGSGGGGGGFSSSTTKKATTTKVAATATTKKATTKAAATSSSSSPSTTTPTPTNNNSAKLRAAIVRPTIIGACAGGPAPGYFGNAAGPTQLMLAYASEMATFLCHNPNHVWDIAPCDVVGGVILGAAAALDVARRVEDARLAKEEEAAEEKKTEKTKKKGEIEGVDDEEKEKEEDEENDAVAAAAAAASAAGAHSHHHHHHHHQSKLLVFHAASSMSNTIRYGDLFTKWVIPFWDDNMPPRRFRASKKYKSIHHWTSFVPEGSVIYHLMRFAGNVKFGALASVLRLAGKKEPADALWKGWRYLCMYNDERLDFGLFFCVRNVELVERAMAEALAPGSPGASAYVPAARGCSTVACCGRNDRRRRSAENNGAPLLLPAGSMTSVGDAIVGAAAAAAHAVAANAAFARAASATKNYNEQTPATAETTKNNNSEQMTATATATTTAATKNANEQTTATATTTKNANEQTATAMATATTATKPSATYLPAPLTWRGDWGPYMLRYSEVINAKFFGPDGALNAVTDAATRRKKTKKEKKEEEEKTSSSKKASTNGPTRSLEPAPSLSTSTTTPRAVRAMAKMAAVRRGGIGNGNGGRGAGGKATAKVVAIVSPPPSPSPSPLVSAPATPETPAAAAAAAVAHPATPTSTPPSTPPNEPSSPARSSSSSPSSPSTPADVKAVVVGDDKVNGDSATNSPTTLFRRRVLTPPSLFSKLTAAAAAASAASAASAPPPPSMVKSDSVRDLSECR